MNASDEFTSTLKGIGIVMIGAVCFGTVYVPIKRCTNEQDGIFVQWMMSLGSLLFGFAVNIVMDNPPMNLIAAAGGILWTFANTIAQFVISSLGLAVALLLWSTTKILTGWAAGRFGLFDLKQKLPENNALNLAGLGFVLFGGVFFAFVKRTPSTEREHRECTFSIPKLSIGQKPKEYGGCAKDADAHHEEIKNEKKGFEASNKIWKKWNRPISVILALISGFFYAATVIPVLYIQDNPESFPDSPTKSGLNFIFSHYFGIFFSATAIFVLYALAKGNQPSIHAPAILPSLGAGAIWGCGMVSLFLANDLLTQTVTYPVLITIPGCVAALWSIFYFKEI